MVKFVKIHLLALLAAFVLVGSAHAAATKFTNVTVTGTLTTATSAVTGNQTVTGVINTSASTPYAVAIGSVTAAVPAGTPSAAGLIAFSTTYVMYVSTGTGPGAWVKVGGQ